MVTFVYSALIDKFISSLKEQGKSSFTMVAYKKDLEQFAGYISSKELNDIRDIKKDDISGFINKLISDNYSKKSA